LKEDKEKCHLRKIDESWLWHIRLGHLNFDHIVSRDDLRCICYQAKNYLIVGDTLYHQGVDNILNHSLNHEDSESIINDFHIGSFGGHLSGLATTQKKLRVSYFWPFNFKDCVEVVKKCHSCQVFTQNMHSYPTPLHPVITIGPFTKWGLDFVDCNPNLVGGN
jgi:hypothetical protein